MLLDLVFVYMLDRYMKKKTLSILKTWPPHHPLTVGKISDDASEMKCNSEAWTHASDCLAVLQLCAVESFQ